MQPESVRFRRMYADTCGSSAQNWHTFCWPARKERVGGLCAFRETLFAPISAFILPCVVSSLCMGRSRCVWVGQPPVLSTSASLIPWWVGGFPHFSSFFFLPSFPSVGAWQECLISPTLQSRWLAVSGGTVFGWCSHLNRALMLLLSPCHPVHLLEGICGFEQCAKSADHCVQGD